MGACASVFPKAMRGDAGAAPPPEPPKEETTTATTAEVVVEGEEKKAEGGEEKNIKEGDEDGNPQSLGSLLNEGEKAKEQPETEKISLSETIKSEKQESEATILPLSDEKAAYIAPVAQATTEDNKETEASNVDKK